MVLRCSGAAEDDFLTEILVPIADLEIPNTHATIRQVLMQPILTDDGTNLVVSTPGQKESDIPGTL